MNLIGKDKGGFHNTDISRSGPGVEGAGGRCLVKSYHFYLHKRAVEGSYSLISVSITF